MYSNISVNNSPKCGEVWMCELVSKNGSIQNGRRPVFILSNNKNNTYAPTLNVIPLTTKMNKKRLPIHVELWNYEQYGLNKPSTMLIEQITTIPMENLIKCIGNISDDDILKNIVAAMSIQFPIMQLANVSVC